MLRRLIVPAVALALMACASVSGKSNGAPAAIGGFDGARMDEVLLKQAADVQSRFKWRHPRETLEFFDVAPGMTVVDTLPGSIWYSGILADYLGPDGKVIGADYAPSMWALFGQFAPPPEKKAVWPAEWVAGSVEWRPENGAEIGALAFGAVPEDVKGQVDVVLMIRALHHFNRLEEEGGFLSAALQDTMAMLKPGGVVGVVQHRAPEANSAKWAEGDNGYLKQSDMIAAFESAGFEFVESSEINANPADKPTESDFVWRLPPSLANSRDNPKLKAEMEAIGESDRMTLKFRKPL